MSEDLKSKLEEVKNQEDSTSAPEEKKSYAYIRDRFYLFILICGLMHLDFHYLVDVKNWGTSISILILQLILIFLLSKWCTIPEISILIDRLLEAINTRNNNNDKD